MLEGVIDIFKSLYFESALFYQNLYLDLHYVIVPEFRLRDCTYVLNNVVAAFTIVSKSPK